MPQGHQYCHKKKPRGHQLRRHQRHLLLLPVSSSSFLSRHNLSCVLGLPGLQDAGLEDFGVFVHGGHSLLVDHVLLPRLMNQIRTQ